jgi:hypothetical protein
MPNEPEQAECECRKALAEVGIPLEVIAAQISQQAADIAALIVERDQLRAELERTRAELEGCEENLAGSQKPSFRVAAECEQLRAELAEALDALRPFADRKSWNMRMGSDRRVIIQRAAAILAKHKDKPDSGGVERAKFTPPVAWEDE